MTTREFEAVVDRHKAMVYSIAYNFFGEITIAEEVAQDVFLELYRASERLTDPLHLKHWLRRTATHRSIDTLRRRTRRQEIQMEVLPEVAVPAREPDPLASDRLSRLVRTLPEKPRAVMLLRYGEDMDVGEIGKILDMPVPTVWSHIRRSIALLRDKMQVPGTEECNERLRQGTS